MSRDVIGGLCGVDSALLEMAEVFRMPAGARWRYLYLATLFGKERGAAGKGEAGRSAAKTAPSGSSVGEESR